MRELNLGEHAVVAGGWADTGDSGPYPVNVTTYVEARNIGLSRFAQMQREGDGFSGIQSYAKYHCVPPVHSTPQMLADRFGIDIKPGAVISELSNEMTATFDEIAEAWAVHATGTAPVITSGNDGQHNANPSLHHSNYAIDLRANNVSTETAQAIAATLQSSLGSSYQVFFESAGTVNAHIHIEFDPGG